MSERTLLKPILALMRKDMGFQGEVERLAQLAWMLALKAVDERETEREILEERYRSPIPGRFRWRTWTAESVLRAEDMPLPFVNSELFAGLQALPRSKDSVSTLVRELAGVARNYMRNGALLASAIEHVNAIDFQHLSSRVALADEFERLLGDGLAKTGDVFTPPPLAQILIELLDPELGETLLDPDFGSGTFLIAALEHVRDRWVRLPQHEEQLAASLEGTERTPFGWLLAITQLLLRDMVATPRIRLCTLMDSFAESTAAGHIDVLTGTLPFTGHADVPLLDSLPPQFRTTHLASLHLFLSSQLLRSGGRAALVVPDGILSKEGVTARIRQALLDNHDLHTIVRLPPGTFAPFTNIRTSVLFFTRGGPTRETWYYEHGLPEGLRAYSRKRPVRAEDFAPLRAFWSDRRETDAAFCVPVSTLLGRELNLDMKHPRLAAASVADSLPPPSRPGTEPEPDAPASPAAARRPLQQKIADSPMRLRTLHLRSFRGFSRLELDLPEAGPAVLIGVNGAGKSTVLDAMGAFLSVFAARVCGLQPGRNAASDLSSSVRAGQDVATAGATFRVDGADQYWELRVNRVTERVTWQPELAREASALRDRLLNGATLSVPVLCWYAATRGFGDSPSARVPPASPFPQLHAYDNAFRRGLGPFADFLLWFRQEEDQENETRLREDPAHRNPRLEIVRRAVHRFMSELGSGYFSDLRIERSASDNERTGALVIEKNGVPLRIEQLSDGEKGTLLLVSDLARRFSLAHAHREDPLSGDGIVLIDEIDRDLHPGWQRAFLPALAATFPACQIIASTHSPQVLSGVHKEHVFLLEDFALVRAPYTYGRDANSILNEAMGVPERLPDVEALIREVGMLIDAERLSDARAALARLGELIGPQDSEVVRLKTLMAFLEE